MNYFIRALFCRVNKISLALGIFCLILLVQSTIFSSERSNDLKDILINNIEEDYIYGKGEYVLRMSVKEDNPEENTNRINGETYTDSQEDKSISEDIFDASDNEASKDEKAIRILVFLGVVFIILIVVNVISRTIKSTRELKSVLKAEDISGKFYRNSNNSQRNNVRKLKKQKRYIENYNNNGSIYENDSDGESVYGAGDIENEGNTYKTDNDGNESIYAAGDVKNEGSRVAEGDANTPSEYALEILKNEGSSYHIPDNINEIKSEYGGERIKNDESAFRIQDVAGETGAYGTAQIEKSKKNIFGELYEDNGSTSGYGNDETMELSENIYGDLYEKR